MRTATRISLLKNPEWQALFFCVLAWSFMLFNIVSPQHANSPHSVAVCMSLGFMAHMTPPNLVYTPFYARLVTAIISDLLPWGIMIAAMMFPILKNPIRHVAFSVRHSDRIFAVMDFLTGYTLIWLAAGVLLLTLPPLLDSIASDQTHYWNALLKASGFILAAAWVWHPARPITMMACGQTRPIRIEGINMHLDSLTYGLKMGINCVLMCWAPMLALVLAHHNFILMCLITIILIIERYYLRHTSKLCGYAWGLMAIGLFSIVAWA